MNTRRTWTGHVFIATSVDGYIATTEHDLDWLVDPPPEPGHVGAQPVEHPAPDYDGFTAEVTHMVMGRGTYDKVTTFDSWAYDRFTTLVLSTTLPAGGDERVTVVRSIPEACSMLADQGAGKAYLDGGQVVTAFLAAGLVEELTITRAPVILGAGLPLFGALPHPVRLVHLGTSTIDGGMISTRYRVTHAGDSND